ncbi:MAG: hypothetical protein AAF585_14810 [Verrucomicrobiota bacterium]
MKAPTLIASLIALFTISAAAESSRAELDRLLEIIKPQAGESPWRDIAWMTDITTARQRAVAEDKPLVIFTAADGSPLGRT